MDTTGDNPLGGQPSSIDKFQPGRKSGSKHNQATVATPTAAWFRMENACRLPRCLMGGTDVMRAQRNIYLPKEEKESDRNYEKRLGRTYLFPGFSKTVEHLSAKPFTETVTLGDTAPPESVELAEEVDRAGRGITQYARDWFRDALIDGLAYTLVDYPAAATDPDGGRPTMTLEDKRGANIGPYFLLIPRSDVIEASGERVGSREILTRARIRETSLEPDGQWGEQQVTRYRVWYPDRWELYQESKEKKGLWIMIGIGENTLGEVPLVPLYTYRTAFHEALPPLRDLAAANLRHWQSSSDQNNILHVARVPILFGIGFEKNDVFEVGPNTMIETVNKDARLEYVEHSGAAINAGKDDLERLEKQMSALGYEPLVQRPGNKTATASAIDSADAQSMLETWARDAEEAIGAAFDMALRWEGVAPPKDGILPNIRVDAASQIADAADVTVLVTVRTNGDLTRESLLNELVRRSFLEDDFDVDAEVAALEKEDEKAKADALTLASQPKLDADGNPIPPAAAPGGGTPKKKPLRALPGGL